MILLRCEISYQSKLMFVKLVFIAITSLILISCQSKSTDPIPILDTKGDVYKTMGENDPLIYDSTIGHKKMIFLYVDFPDLPQKIDSKERGNKVLGNGKFEEIFVTQSYGKLSFSYKHIYGWRRLSKNARSYSTRTTESHRAMFEEIFALYPEVDLRDYDYIVACMQRVGNTAFGERDDLAIPYRGSKINVAMNISSGSPYVLAHEIAHLMGLPDVYTYGSGKIGDEASKLVRRNPAGPWDIMSSAGSATGFVGWHRHKLKWLDADRKLYLSKGHSDRMHTPWYIHF